MRLPILQALARLEVMCFVLASVVSAGRFAVDPSLSLVVKRFLLGQSPPPPSPGQAQDLKIIGAGFGRTGTTSFAKAMDRLGLNAYNIAHILGAPGHAVLWPDYVNAAAATQEQGPGAATLETLTDQLVEAIRDAGFNATSSMPSCFLHKEFMKRYPNAKVVLTVRGHPDGDEDNNNLHGKKWAASIQNTLAVLMRLFHRPPFRWLSRPNTVYNIVAWCFDTMGAPMDPTTDTLDTPALAKAYETWRASVIDAVPADRLLVFAPTDGWQKLCDIVAPLDDEIQQNCQEVLESGEPYPRSNEAAHVKRVLRILTLVALFFNYHGPLFAALAGIILLSYWWMRRNRPRSKKAKKE